MKQENMVSRAVLVNIKQVQQGSAGHIRYWVVPADEAAHSKINLQGPACALFLRSAMG